METSIDAAPSAMIACIGCGGRVPAAAGPTHRYMRSSPGCWQLYGALGAAWQQARDQMPMAAIGHHVDAYAVQHPGGAEHDRRQRQSVAVHLITLCRHLEDGVGAQQALRERGRTSEVVLGRFAVADWPYLAPPGHLGAVTVADIGAAPTGPQQRDLVEAWVRSAWSAWGKHHSTVATWAGAMGQVRR